MRRIIGAVAVANLLAAGCGASINPAYKAEVDRALATPANTASYPAIDSFEPMPLAVGQWIELKVVDAKKRPALVTYKIVGQEGTAFWVEIENVTYSGKTENRLLIEFGDRKNPETMDVKAFSSRVDGKLHDYPPGLLGLLRSMWKPLVQNLAIVWNDLPREDQRVTAGSFAGCYKRRSSVAFGSYEQTSDNWAHPAVPINGAVRSVGIDSPSSIELLAFGTEGAKSTF